MGQTFTVSTAAELSAAINNASGGDRIELEGGHYGELFLRSKDFNEDVVITSADPEDPATFAKIDLLDVSHMTFDSISVDFEPTENTGYKVGFKIWECDNITVSNSLIQGGPNANHPDPLYAVAPVGHGLQIRYCESIAIENNEIAEFHAGINYGYIDDFQIIDNYIHDLRTSPISGGAVNDVEISGNHIATSNPINWGGSGDHGDMIHVFPLAGQTEPMENIVIRDNFLEQGEGSQAILGIYIDDAGSAGSGIGYTNVVIENNLMHNGNLQGIRAENVDGLSIMDNTLLQSTGGAGSAPGIVLTSGTQNVVLDNNIIAGTIQGSSISGGNITNLNIEIGENVFVQNSDPFGENYVGDLFTNALTRNGDVGDFQTLDGTVVSGYGANIDPYTFHPGAHFAVIDSTRGEGLDMQTIHFDAQSLFDSEGEIDFSTAELTWDFGDGTTGTGDNIDHAYESAGNYNVNATFTFGDGTQINVDKVVHVFTPDAVVLDFEDRIADVSDIRNQVNTIGNVRTEDSRFGEALRLIESGSKVEVRQSEEILDNPDFSISFAFQKDGGTATNTDDGMFVYFSGTSYISTGEGTLAFSGKTSTGRSIRLEAEADQIEDGEWHQLTYTFSSEDRSAVLYLDGQEVDRMDNVSGIQHTTNGHNLLLGGRVGGAFGGLMDEFEFTRAALTPEEVEERYETLFNGEPEEEPVIPDVEPEPGDDPVIPEPPNPEPEPEVEPEPEGPVTPPEPEPEEEPEEPVTPEPEPETPEPPAPEPEPEPESEEEPEEPVTPPEPEPEVVPEEPVTPEPVIEPHNVTPEPEFNPESEPEVEPSDDPDFTGWSHAPEGVGPASHPASGPVNPGPAGPPTEENPAEGPAVVEEEEDESALDWVADVFSSVFEVLARFFGLNGRDEDSAPQAAPAVSRAENTGEDSADLFDILTSTGQLDEAPPQWDDNEEDDPFAQTDGLLI